MIIEILPQGPLKYIGVHMREHKQKYPQILPPIKPASLKKNI